MFRMIAPHVGMALLTAVYTLAGAMVFYTIEAPNEKLLREHCIEEVCSHPQISTKHIQIRQTRKALIDHLWNMSQQDDRGQWIDEADKHLDALSHVLYNWYAPTRHLFPA
jgi:hypothetical protein